jgi:iron complex outermembrane receptor protein
VFPAVITYFNEVPVPQVAQGVFFDLANVQVLRGPQGVNFGRVTDGGNIMLSPQMPKDEFGGYVGVKLGNYALRTFNGALNVPIVADTVLLRGAFEVARRDGFTTNLANGKKLDDVAYESYRGALTLRPFEGVENTTVVNYQHTHDNGTGVILAGINEPALSANYANLAFFSAGYGFNSNGDIVPAGPGATPYSAANLFNPAIPGSITAQLAAQQARGKRKVSLNVPLKDERTNLYIVNTTAVQLSDSIELKNVFGYIHEKQDQIGIYSPLNGATNYQCHSACGGKLFNNREQFSEELRLSGRAIDGKLNWVLGGYIDEQSPAGEYENAVRALGILDRTLVNYITTKSRGVYGSVEYEITDKLTVNGGLRYTRDTIHSEQTDYKSLLPLPGAQAAFANTLMGALGFDAATAGAVAAATYAPIPHGKCVSFGAGSLLYGGVAAPCQVIDEKYTATTWTAGINYKTGSGQMVYAKVSKGYRPGGVNSTTSGDPRYNPETDVSVELGAKAVFDLDGVPLRANIAAYRDRYKAIQKIIVSIVNGTSLADVRNVDDAVVKGIEFDGSIGPVAGFTLGGTFAYTDAQYDKKNGVFSSLTDACDPNALSTNGKFCAFNRFNATPKTQYTIRLDYALPLPESVGQVSVGGLLYHQSSAALNDSSRLNPASINAPYTTLDLTANWHNVLGAPVDLGMFVTNLTNKTYRIGTNDLTQRSSLGVRGDIYAAPRMWGFSLKYRFGSDAN